MLLRHGADPTLRSADGKSPIDLVARRRDKTCLNLFLSSRALRG
jgi:ankyrin repeat protein